MNTQRWAYLEGQCWTNKPENWNTGGLLGRGRYRLLTKEESDEYELLKKLEVELFAERIKNIIASQQKKVSEK